MQNACFQHSHRLQEGITGYQSEEVGEGGRGGLKGIIISTRKIGRSQGRQQGEDK